MNSQLAQDVWLLVCTALVLIMQPGFLCLEAGAVRRKNSVNVAMKNFVVELVSTTAFFVVGYALMFGISLGGWLGTPSLLLSGLSDRDLLHFLFQAVFCGTAATIVSGAVAERLRFMPFVLESALLCAFLYPLFGHWVWGGGWLAQMGFKDFAGGAVVHLMGAAVALAGVLILGPRKGRFDGPGGGREIPPGDLVLSSLGTFILLFGWIGFNGGSAPLGDSTARIVACTLVAGCFGGVATLLSSLTVSGASNAGLILNGTLGGLVAITPCADGVPLAAAPVIGVLAGIAVHCSTVLLEKWKIDDAVGVLPVHGVSAIVGLLSVSIFASQEVVAAQTASHGLGRWSWLAVQAFGSVVCLVTGFVGGWLIWKIVSSFTPLRVTPEGELVGMNYSEHRLPDPIAEMTLALQARGGKEIDMDLVRGSEFEVVGRAFNALLEELQRQRNEVVRWRQGLDEATGRLDGLARSGRGRQQLILQALTEVRDKLAHLAQFSREVTSESGQHVAALRVAGDLVESLRTILSQALVDDGRVQNAWEQLDHLVQTLAGIGRRMEMESAR